MERLFLTDSKFLLCSKKILNRKSMNHRQFVSHFGVSPRIAALAWNRMISDETLPLGGKPFHLLWTLCWLKTYQTEAVICSICNIGTENTFRKWRDLMLEELKYIDLVSNYQVVVCSFVAVPPVWLQACFAGLKVPSKNKVVFYFFIILYRSESKTDSWETSAMCARCLLMELTSGSENQNPSVPSGTVRSSMGPVWGMKWVSV